MLVIEVYVRQNATNFPTKGIRSNVLLIFPGSCISLDSQLFCYRHYTGREQSINGRATGVFVRKSSTVSGKVLGRERVKDKLTGSVLPVLLFPSPCPSTQPIFSSIIRPLFSLLIGLQNKIFTAFNINTESENCDSPMPIYALDISLDTTTETRS